jgi:hypothetical protein
MQTPKISMTTQLEVPERFCIGVHRCEDESQTVDHFHLISPFSAPPALANPKPQRNIEVDGITHGFRQYSKFSPVHLDPELVWVRRFST